ncbi:hypothetical protein RV11_GL002491 [Enterococcus phoeniculicola]|jgi:hypothetical protein|uniref:DUF4279 domain-containing protein n=1 Tax=Enterococcus phoeniculicola ATCC BAA-412 TaxID=1158610 RepID=R3WB96_9ENTE|nr:DUF4279 domain-containing protein [Enterococcus phoeniculicola]EOL44742.1 hypothetical protein UC3_01559 [Enterococcus phoeniculicola ATCC BAA-412]EOT75031.1 hypothetical protein I589_02631 [Enterococcus phoeniculicola ATCC BAA-412]OJG72917.1 hypothetical protein RV11_GL002491 [Enterococcus phoeniculicola]
MSATRVKVKLTIEGEDLDPNIVTEKIGLTPNITHKRGEKLKNNRTRRHGSWGIIQEFEESYDISIQLNKLLGLITNKEDKLLYIKEMYSCTIIVSVIIEIENKEVPGIVIEEGFSSLVSKIGADIDIDIYIMS